MGRLPGGRRWKSPASGHSFSQVVEYVSTFSNSGTGNTYSGGTAQVATDTPPRSFAITEYEPGGAKALAAAADYHSVSGAYTLTAGRRLPPNPSASLTFRPIWVLVNG